MSYKSNALTIKVVGVGGHIFVMVMVMTLCLSMWLTMNSCDCGEFDPS